MNLSEENKCLKNAKLIEINEADENNTYQFLKFKSVEISDEITHSFSQSNLELLNNRIIFNKKYQIYLIYNNNSAFFFKDLGKIVKSSSNKKKKFTV